jgi:hypothetical protein
MSKRTSGDKSGLASSRAVGFFSSKRREDEKTDGPMAREGHRNPLINGAADETRCADTAPPGIECGECFWQLPTESRHSGPMVEKCPKCGSFKLRRISGNATPHGRAVHPITLGHRR